ncbi:DUF3846 domain-containing protein [Glutamicibacter ardleyensis]|uniref:DUF3846 domain-containing protein n=1 Tax=Glutamicibacter ardleyensis TaxID=225894 RepID=UPI003FCF532E
MSNNFEALKVTADGTTEMVTLARDENGRTLHSLYEAIGCSTVQYLGANHNIDVVIDEEGKLTNEEPNLHATLLAMRMGFTFFSGDYIAGTALFVGHDGEGETVSLNDEQKELFNSVLIEASI